MAVDTQLHPRGYYSEGVTSPERLDPDEFMHGPEETEFSSSPTHSVVVTPIVEPVQDENADQNADSKEGAEYLAAAEQQDVVDKADPFNEDDPYEAMFAHLDYSKRSVEPKVSAISFAHLRL